MTIVAASNFAGFDLLRTLWTTRPAHYARMTYPGSSSKYVTIHSPFTDEKLFRHILGIATFAAPLIGGDKFAKALVLELDEGGMEYAQRVLAVVERHHLTAFSFVVKGAGNHDGSHTWILYKDFFDPVRLQVQSIALLNAAGLPVKEIYPSNKSIRLPFGMHRWTDRRGTLVVQTGEVFNLDDSVEFARGIEQVCSLPLNTTQPPSAIQIIGHTYSAGLIGYTSGDVRPGTDFNARCPQAEIITMLTRRGWTIVQQYGDIIYLRRPGKQTGGHSASVGYLPPGNILCVFSTEDPALPHNRPGVCTAYTPWAVFTYLYHNGDFIRSARYLYSQGYGTPFDRRRQP